MLKLKAASTFTAKVKIPLAGGSTVIIGMHFKHMRKSAFNDLVRPKDGEPIDEAELVMSIVSGWEVADAGVEFSREAVNDLLEEHYGAAAEIVSTYTKLLNGAKSGN